MFSKSLRLAAAAALMMSGQAVSPPESAKLNESTEFAKLIASTKWGNYIQLIDQFAHGTGGDEKKGQFETFQKLLDMLPAEQGVAVKKMIQQFAIGTGADGHKEHLEKFQSIAEKVQTDGLHPETDELIQKIKEDMHRNGEFKELIADQFIDEMWTSMQAHMEKADPSKKGSPKDMAEFMQEFVSGHAHHFTMENFQGLLFRNMHRLPEMWKHAQAVMATHKDSVLEHVDMYHTKSEEL